MRSIVILIFGIAIGGVLQLARQYSLIDVKNFLESYKIFFEVLISTGTMAAAFFAYLSARSSEMSGRAGYVPVISIDGAHMSSHGSGFHVRNIATSEYATAKDIVVTIGGKEFYHSSFDGNQGTIWPVDLEKVDMRKIKGSITYEDIFSRQYKLSFYFEEKRKKLNEPVQDYKELNVKISYKKFYL